MHLSRHVAVLGYLALTFVVCVSGQFMKNCVIHESDCEVQITCAKCTPSCKQCSENISPSTDADGNRCSTANIINPPSKNITTIENKEFSSVIDNLVQLKPQRLRMKLRAGREQIVKIQYKQALDYPVDLYFLMDLSFSMERHRDKLSSLGDSLSNAVRNITSNFRLGFGSFVDKCIQPMTNTNPKWLKTHCRLRDGSICAPPYDYKHQMSLTSDIRAFKDRVKAAPISGNIDPPEGGLDALMQAMVCGERIGWRKEARHILVYSSDATYHIAGDGRVAGLTEPNDEECHLNEEGFYDHAEILDYPSVSQIHKIARDHNKMIIFAVTSNVGKQYRNLSRVIEGSVYGILSKNSENVVDLVKSYTEELTQRIKMSAKADKMFEIKYSSRPVRPDPSVRCEGDTCSGISDKTPVEFDVSIKALECPDLEEKRHQKIELKLEGIPEKVIIEVDLICDCVNCTKGTKSSKRSGSLATYNIRELSHIELVSAEPTTFIPN